MKHPALTRIFAIVLTVLCLVMLLAGLGSAASAVSQRQKDLEAAERLTNRVEEYEQTLAAMEGTTPYEQANLAFSQQQEEHEQQAAKHRTDLAIYTATRSGLQTGAAALQQATAALAQGKEQYEQGLALFEQQEAAFAEGYRQFQEGKRQLAEGRKTLELAATALNGLRTQLEQMKALGTILESDDENARKDLTVAAYDSLLTSLDQVTALYDTLKAQGGISPEQLQQLVTLLAQQTDLDAEELLSNLEWQGITEETLQEFEAQVTETTGMTVEEIRGKIQEQRDSIADLDGDAPISEAQFAAMQAAYAQSREQLAAIESALEGEVDNWSAQLGEAKTQMDAAQEQIDQMDAYMEQGKAGMEQGRAALEMAGSQIRQGEQALNDGRAELHRQQNELRKKAEQLQQEKEELDAEAEKLEKESERVKRQRTLEKRELSLRLMLSNREAIAQRMEEGMTLTQAAGDYADQLSREARQIGRGRLRVSLLMLVGAIAGQMGIPAAFEKTKSRFWLIGPVLLCLGCAVGAEVLCRHLGRGDSYSALAVAIFAGIQLLLVIPRKKPDCFNK